MRSWWLFALVPAVASAAPVIGGSDAPAGMWPDAAAVKFPDGSADDVECSGTLIAPTVVITAGHCATLAEPPLPDHVLVGTNSLDHPELGELISIAHVIEYPNSQSTIDVGVLVLATASTVAPRAIATGWARLDIQNGAAIELVGYGAVDAGGTMQVPELQEAATTITDDDCTTSPGCNAGAQPDGELGAGGGGIDTCPGDSGGPLYLLASYGTFLAGVTSRAYANATQACGGGGIYERPDKVIAWIEQVAGVPVTHGPEPALDGPLDVMGADGAEATATIAANDPLATDHTFAIKAQPVHGSASVGADGRLRVCSTGSDGSDSVTVTVTDAGSPERAVDETFAIATVDAAGAGSCDASMSDARAGCCDAGGGGGPGSVLLAAGVLAIARRRR